MIDPTPLRQQSGGGAAAASGDEAAMTAAVSHAIAGELWTAHRSRNILRACSMPSSTDERLRLAVLLLRDAHHECNSGSKPGTTTDGDPRLLPRRCARAERGTECGQHGEQQRQLSAAATAQQLRRRLYR